MIYAELKSKIPEVKRSEDILTSNVFTLFKILPEEYILKLICKIVPSSVSEKIKDKKVSEFSLWKKFSNLKEPEIYIKLDPEYYVLVEIKYMSPESGETQLKDYLGSIPFENKILIYLTADRTEPILTTKKSMYKGLPIYWTNWHKLKSAIEELFEKETDKIIQNIYKLIITYLNHKGFSYFDGWHLEDIQKFMKIDSKIWRYK